MEKIPFTVRTVLQSNNRIIETETRVIPLKQIRDRSLS